MQLIEIGYNQAVPFHVGQGAYTVEIGIGGGAHAYHVGLGKYPYFTENEAKKLADAVSMSGHINPAQWTDGYGKPLKASDVSPRPALSFA